MQTKVIAKVSQGARPTEPRLIYPPKISQVLFANCSKSVAKVGGQPTSPQLGKNFDSKWNSFQYPPLFYLKTAFGIGNVYKKL